MIEGVAYRPVPAGLERWFATLHRGEFVPGRRVAIPALLGQIWFCSVPIWWRAPGRDEPTLLPTVAMLGPTTAAIEIMVERPGFLLGCGLWPLGWAELVQRHAATHADTAIDAARLWPEACAALAAAGGGGGEDAWRALDGFAAALAAQARPSPDRDRIAVIDAWLATAGDVASLRRQLACCPRHTARITRRTHGGSPRLIAAKWRVLKAASELGHASPTGAWWSDRFADQSHFIREFRRFIGETPKGFSRSPEGIPQRVVADAWHLESDHPLALYRAADVQGD